MMKKLRYLLFVILLPALIAVSCENPTEEDDNTGVPAAGTKLVEKLSVTFQAEYGLNVNLSYDILFSYDSKNRIVKMDRIDYIPEDEGYTYYTSISYGHGKVTLEIRERHSNENTIKYIYTLNSDGSLSRSTGERRPGSDDYTYTYNNGYINKIIYVTEEASISNKYTYKYDYTWSDGNLTGIGIKYEYENENGKQDEDESLYSVSYGTTANPANVNVDMNFLVLPMQAGEDLLSILGFYGKSCKNLVSSYSLNEMEAYITWQTDSDGNVTEVYKERKSQTASVEETYKVTYKK